MDDLFEERLHQVSPPSEREDASSPSSVSLTDSHRDPSAGAPTRQVVSSAGAEYSRRCWRRDCLLVPLEDLLQRQGLSNRQVASTLTHRRRQCDQMPWPAFLDKVQAKLDAPTRDVTNAFLEQVAIIIQRRLTANEFQRIRSGRWNDPGKSAVEAIFTRLLVSQLSDGDLRCARLAPSLVERSIRRQRYAGYWATLSENLVCLDDRRKNQFWEWYRLFPRAEDPSHSQRPRRDPNLH